jgi:hypothetical protein
MSEAAGPTINEIAAMAYTLWPPAGERAGSTTQGAYAEAVADGWAQFVHDCGGFYTNTEETQLTIGVQEFTLPADVRQPIPNGIYLSYIPKNIKSISRTSNVASVETSSAHGLQTGMHVKITGVTPGNGDEYDTDDTEVTVVSTTVFTYENEGDDDTGSGGTVECIASRRVLVWKDLSEADNLPSYEVSSGTPECFYFVDSQTIRIQPVSDGKTYPSLIVVYDAEAPEVGKNEPLPCPVWAKRGLAAYAAFLVGGWPNILPLYEDAVKRWRAAIRRRTADPSLSV